MYPDQVIDKGMATDGKRFTMPWLYSFCLIKTIWEELVLRAFERREDPIWELVGVMSSSYLLTPPLGQDMTQGQFF